MTFFYDLNKKLADIGAKSQLNEDSQVNEKYMGFSKLEKEIAKRGDVKDAGAVAASIGRKKYGKAKFQKAAAAGKKLGEQGANPGLFKQVADRVTRTVQGKNNQTDTGAQMPPSVKEQDDIQKPRHPQELDYQAGPEDDEQYRRHHGLDDPLRKRERKLRATDHKTLDRLERQAMARAKQMDEEDIDEVSRGEYIKQQDTKAERTGKDKFKAFGQTFDTDEVDEGKNDPHPLDDPLTRFRKKHAPSVMRDPKGREEVSKLDTEYGERKKTGYGRGEEEDEDDEDSGKKKAKPAGEKRGRGRPKGTKRAIGAKGPTGRSKLLTRESDMAEDYGREELDEISNKRGYDNAYEVHGNKFGYYVWRKSPISQVLNIGITDPGLTGLTNDDPRSSGIQNFVKQNMKPVSFNSLSPGIKKLILNQLPLRSTSQQNADSVSSDGNRINYDIPGNERWASIDAERTKNRALKQKLKQNMGMTEDYDQDEYDEEGEMAMSQARTIEDAAEELQSILDADENLPEWVQKKISMAKEYIDTARDYLKANRPEEEPMVAEKAVSKAQRRAAGIAHAAKKGDIPKSELRGASKEMAKMAGGELKKFAKTKEKGLPQKKTEEVEETTTAGNVAPAAEPAKGGKKGSMQFGKGIYDSMNRELEAMIAESMNVSVNMTSEGPNGPTKSVTVTATDEDADMLAALLTRSGLGGGMRDDTACPTCGSSPCGCAEQVDENEPDYPTEPVASDDAMQYAGGLNKPKSTGQTTTPIIANQDEREVAYDDDGDELRRIREMAGVAEAKKSKPDFLDVDKDGDKAEPFKKAVKDKEEKVDEAVEQGLWNLWKRIQ